MHHKIIYLSFGGTKFYDQTRFSILTLLDLLLKQNRNDIRILVFTDCPKETPVHDFVESFEITPSEIGLFRGPLDFVHRVKLEVLRRAEATIGLPFIYVDCDTRWIKIPNEPLDLLANGEQVFFMHKDEGSISDNYFPDFFRLLHDKKSQLLAWGVRSVPPWNMWNAGTVGIPAKATGLIDQMLTINDALLPYAKSRTFVEQLSVSLVATTRFDVKPFDDCLIHYWGYSHELPVVLRRFFVSLPSDLSVEKMAEQCGLFSLDETKMQDMHRSPLNRLTRLRKRISNSFRKRKGDFTAWRLRNGI